MTTRTRVYARRTTRRKDLPPQRARVLAFIKEEIARGRGFPRLRTIAEKMGWAHADSARAVLLALCGDGHLRSVRIGKSLSFVLAPEEAA